ncbi:MAG: hypothetical protein HUU20_07210 [Pirellulales bacterium]|nr:hypothetical protein [Pirellulales bacterium]
MAATDANKVLELFGCATRRDFPWRQIIKKQWCPFTNTKCFKVRKSEPDISIGTCSVRYGKKATRDIIICPNRLLEGRRVFMDCLHLLTQHDPGNELPVVPEVSIPGGSVDYFLASVKKGRVNALSLRKRRQFLRALALEHPSIRRFRPLHPLFANCSLLVIHDKPPFFHGFQVSRKPHVN